MRFGGPELPLDEMTRDSCFDGAAVVAGSAASDALAVGAEAVEVGTDTAVWDTADSDSAGLGTPESGSSDLEIRDSATADAAVAQGLASLVRPSPVLISRAASALPAGDMDDAEGVGESTGP